MKKYMLKCKDYDLFVIDSRNADTTQEQLPDDIKNMPLHFREGVFKCEDNIEVTKKEKEAK